MRFVNCLSAPLLAIGLIAAPALAQADYPEQPVEMIIPFPPGSPVDIFGRVLSERLEREVGQPVVVNNRPGAGGTIGTTALAQSEPDGYTILLATTSVMGPGPVLYDLDYDPLEDIAPIFAIGTTGLMILANAEMPFDTVDDLIDHAINNPGELSFASGGVGTTQHLSGEVFMDATGAEMVHIPYPGSEPAMVDLMAGRVHLQFNAYENAASRIAEGSVKPIAVLRNQRHPNMPDVPTVAEAGHPELEQKVGYFGVFAPAGTPEDRLELLEAALSEVLADEAFQQRLTELGNPSPAIFSRSELWERMQEDVTFYEELVERIGLQLD